MAKRFKKGSIEAKRFMAKIRLKKGKPGSSPKKSKPKEKVMKQNKNGKYFFVKKALTKDLYKVEAKDLFSLSNKITQIYYPHLKSLSDKTKQFLIDSIDLSGYNQNAPNNYEKVKMLEKIFYSEYGFMITRIGKLKSLEEWLSGLPSSINIPFQYNDIIQLAIDLGSIKQNSSEKIKNKILINYFKYMANNLLQLFNKKINYYKRFN